MTKLPTSAPSDKREALADRVIESLYQMALDPTSCEQFVDDWEPLARKLRNDQGAGTDRQKPDKLASHFTRAAQMLDAVAQPADTAPRAALLERIRHSAAFCVDPDHCISAANDFAHRAFGVSVGDRILALPLESEDHDDLGRQINKVLRGCETTQMVLRYQHKADRRQVVFLLQRITPCNGDHFVLILSSDVVWPPGFDKLLISAFGLTPAEIEVLVELAAGKNISDIAEARGRAVTTVRAQVKALQSKTDTRTQSELMRLILTTMQISSDEVSARHHVEQQGTSATGLKPIAPSHIRRPDGRRVEYYQLGDPAGRPCLYLPMDYGWSAGRGAQNRRRVPKASASSSRCDPDMGIRRPCPQRHRASSTSSKICWQFWIMSKLTSVRLFRWRMISLSQRISPRHIPKGWPP